MTQEDTEHREPWPGMIIDEVSFTVERGKILEFARASHASDRIHTSPDEARTPRPERDGGDRYPCRCGRPSPQSGRYARQTRLEHRPSRRRWNRMAISSPFGRRR